MTTYTLTQAQYDELHGTFANRDILRILKSFKPNSQEPDAVVFQSARNYDGEWSSIVITKTELQKETELYTNPASISKEDMVKVLGALRMQNTGNLPSTVQRLHEQRMGAITIMQSAIEGMK